MSANTPNLRAVHQFFELMKAKDIDGWAKLWANDGTILVCYPPQGFPDSINGKEQIVAGFRQLFGHFGTYDYQIKSTYITTNADVVVVEWDVVATLPERGTIYRGNNITVFRFRNGLISHYHDYFDPRKFQIVVDALAE
jgi:Ketosteroid isomerase-related protein